MSQHNLFTNSEIAASYEVWYSTTGRWADQQEKALMKQLLKGFPSARSILEIGCGTGHFTRWFSQQGKQAIGLDASRAMLNEAKRFGSELLLQGNALKIPFALNSFDMIALITTLEFFPDANKVINEVQRVASQGFILGVINSQSSLGRKYKRSGNPIWETAKLFSPDQLKHLILENTTGKIKIVWRTTLWPLLPISLPLPWGGFIGMSVKWK